MNEEGAPPSDSEANGFFTGVRPVAVAVGALVDQVSTLLLNVVLFSAMADRFRDTDGSIDQKALERLSQDPDVLGSLFFIGTFCTALGGYMGARMVTQRAAKNGAFVGLAGVLMALLAYGGQPGIHPPPLWYDLSSFAVLVPAGALGGWLWGRRASADGDPVPRDDGET